MIRRMEVPMEPQEKVPEHIWQLIFQECVPSDEVELPGPDVERWLFLTKVCSAWRSLALNTPELWCSVCVQMKKDAAHRIYVAHEWLKRAGNRPRVLRVEPVTELLDDPSWGADVVDQLILPFKYQILDVKLPYTQLQRVMLLGPEATEHLVILDLRAANLFDTEHVTAPTMFHSGARFPRLMGLGIWAYLKTDLLETIVPWSQMRFVEIAEDLSLTASLNILRQCTALEHVRISVGDDPIRSALDNSLIYLPNVLFMSLALKHGHMVEIFFRRLVVPQVRKLDIVGTLEFLQYDPRSFVEMARRSKMDHIRILKMSHGTEPHRVDELLRCVPSLESFTFLGRSTLSMAAMEDLATGRLGPNLTGINFEAIGDVLPFLLMLEERYHKAGTKCPVTGAVIKPIMDAFFTRAEVHGNVDRTEEVLNRLTNEMDMRVILMSIVPPPEDD